MSDRDDRERTAGIVLAGGPGSRLGLGRSKAWARTPDGRTFLDVALATLEPACRLVFVAAPAAIDLPAAHAFHVRVHDRAQGGGPLAGLVAALEYAGRCRFAHAFVLAVDLPPLAAADLARLRAAGGARATAVVPCTARGLEPMLAFVDVARFVPAAEHAWQAGERAVHRVFEGLGPAGLVTVDAEDPRAWPAGPGALAGVNTPEDYARAWGRSPGRP